MELAGVLVHTFVVWKITFQSGLTAQWEMSWDPYFYTFLAWMVWMPSAQAAEKITAALTVHARVIIAFNRRVITFV